MSAASTAPAASAVPAAEASPATTAERAVALARGVVLATTLLMVEADLLLGTRPLQALDALVLVALIYAIGTSAAVFAGHERAELQLPLLVVDTVLVTAIIYSAGGVRNEYYLLYYLPILQASVRLNFRDAIATSVLASALYGLVAVSAGRDALIPTSAQLRSFTFAASALFMAVFFGLLNREARQHIRRSEEMERLAQALSSKNAELEEKTRELAAAQQSLLASERLATIGELAASLGHELRNPLGVIRNAAYYVRTRVGGRDPDVDEMTELMDAEVSSCDRTIAALLDFARPQEATLAPLALNESLSAMFQKLPPPSGVTIKLELSPDLPLARGDSHQLEQIVANITDNAYQAMHGGGTLTVRTGLDPADGTLRLEFSDTGPGIPPENLPRIFDPLFTTKAKGIGLGLVVCKRLAERQGGRLEARSEPGQGATLTLHLPSAGAAGAAAEAEPPGPDA